mgnify:CR=1 FL=1
MKLTVKHKTTEVTIDEEKVSDGTSIKYEDHNNETIRLLNSIFENIKKVNK